MSNRLRSASLLCTLVSLLIGSLWLRAEAAGESPEGGRAKLGMWLMDFYVGMNLQGALKLTTDQAKAVDAIYGDREAAWSKLGRWPKDPSEAAIHGRNMDEADANASERVVDLLDSGQKKNLARVLNDMETLFWVQLPSGTAQDIKLTDKQRKLLDQLGAPLRDFSKSCDAALRRGSVVIEDAAARRKRAQSERTALTKALASLTSAQRAVVNQWNEEHGP